MTIHWDPDDPIDPNSIDVWHETGDGSQTKIGSVDMSDLAGMPDDIGAVAPNRVRRLAEDHLSISAYEADRRINYVRANPD